MSTLNEALSASGYREVVHKLKRDLDKSRRDRLSDVQRERSRIISYLSSLGVSSDALGMIACGAHNQM